MVGSLSEEHVAHYRATGQVGPVALLTSEEVAHYRGKLSKAEADIGGPLSRVPALRAKTHLLYTWMDEPVSLRAA